VIAEMSALDFGISIAPTWADWPQALRLTRTAEHVVPRVRGA